MKFDPLHEQKNFHKKILISIIYNYFLKNADLVFVIFDRCLKKKNEKENNTKIKSLQVLSEIISLR